MTQGRSRRASRVLVIAGSDPSGGAGLQGDVATLAALGSYAMAVPSALTVQAPSGVRQTQGLPARETRLAIRRLRRDFSIDAIKIGMLLDVKTVEAVARGLERSRSPIVLDPVLRATRGPALSRAGLLDALCLKLLPLCTLLTPNLEEATALTGWRVRDVETMIAAAQALRSFGPQAVLVKGGHLDGDAIDVYVDDRRLSLLQGPRIRSLRTHGTGCALSTAIAHFLGQGHTACRACVLAKTNLERALREDHAVGRGLGAVAHAAMLGSPVEID